jgi:hypothetical protein
MGVFRWLLILSVLASAIVGGIAVYHVLADPTYSFASSTGASGTVPAPQVPGVSAFIYVYSGVQVLGLAIVVLSGILYGRTRNKRWRIALWVAASVLFLYNLLGIFSFGLFFLPAAFLALLAAFFSLGVRAASEI